MFAFKTFITEYLSPFLNSVTLKRATSMYSEPDESNPTAVLFYYLQSQSSLGSTSFGSLLKHSEITRLSLVTKVFLWKFFSLLNFFPHFLCLAAIKI